MDKGFNDDELADIMSEIESLEQEFAEENIAKQQDFVEEESHSESEPVAEQTNFSEDVQIDQEMEEVLDELSQMPVEQSVPQEQKVHQLNQAPKFKSNSNGAHSSLNFKVEGNMTVELGFQVGSQYVSIAVNEGEGLVISMDSGAKFVLPVQQGHHRKAG